MNTSHKIALVTGATRGIGLETVRQLAAAGVHTLLAGRSLTEHLALYAQLPQQVGLAAQLVFSIFPWLQTRRLQVPPG